MSLITDFARQGKDRALSRTLMVLGRKFVSKYGTLCDIKLDSHERKIELQVLLKGEPAPIEVLINRYDIVSEGENSYVIFHDITVSREWMKILAEDHLCGKKFEIPHKYARLLDVII
ncbi:MAG TPA: hypothetical protein PKM95_05475 [Deltaproteobacteria bacterium]|nr:hypothetical protein [Deltaproteobacteria bacterium]HRR19833.1 hypothetical protein [Desulfomonilia bacterium]HRR67667.1 hypothetical protein [Desulfomonilia bacterium]HRT43607.1 hypothetical protein [Desulfomonilia bacterium]